MKTNLADSDQVCEGGRLALSSQLRAEVQSGLAGQPEAAPDANVSVEEEGQAESE